MKSIIDDAGYMVIYAGLPYTNQSFTNPDHSHSIVAGGLPEMS